MNLFDMLNAGLKFTRKIVKNIVFCRLYFCRTIYASDVKFINRKVIVDF